MGNNSSSHCEQCEKKEVNHDAIQRNNDEWKKTDSVYKDGQRLGAELCASSITGDVCSKSIGNAVGSGVQNALGSSNNGIKNCVSNVVEKSLSNTAVKIGGAVLGATAHFQSTSEKTYNDQYHKTKDEMLKEGRCEKCSESTAFSTWKSDRFD